MYFFMIIQRRALPIVWDSSVIWKVAADKSGAAPLNCGGKERSGLARAPLRICWDPPSAHDFDLFCSEVSHLASSRFSFVNGRQKTAGWTWFPIRKANSSIAAYGHAHYSPSRGRKDGPLAPCFVRRLRASDGG